MLSFATVTNLVGVPALWALLGVQFVAPSLTLAIILSSVFITLYSTYTWSLRNVSKESLVFSLFLLIELISRFIDPGEGERGHTTSAAVSLIAFFGIAVAMTSSGGRSGILRGIKLSVLVSFGIFTIEIVFLPEFFSSAPGRVSGLFGNPNFAAAVMTGCLALLLSARRGRLSRFDWMLVVLVTLAVLLTASRAGIVAIALIVIWWASSRYSARSVVLGTLAAAFSALGIALLLIALDQSNSLEFEAAYRIRSILTGFESGDDSTAARVDAAQYSWILITENPSGLGAGASKSSLMFQGPHNMFLAFTLDFGWGWGGAYVLFWALLGALAFFSRSRSLRRQLLWIWMTVAFLSSHNMHDAAPVAVVAVGLAVARQNEMFRG